MKLRSLKSLSTAVKFRNGARIFGTGAAKTGTHSIGEMFSDAVFAFHEQDAEKLIRLHLERETTGNAKPLHRYLRVRDRLRNLKIDSSQINIYLINDLEQLFPESLYILTIRRPLDWLRSMIDDSLRRDTTETWLRFRDYRFGPKASLPHETPLETRDLYSVGGYLKYWTDSIENVISRVTPERLLIIKTHEISGQIEQIAHFCGIPAESVTPEKTRSFVNPERFGVLAELDPEYLIDTVEAACGDLTAELFPDYSIRDAVAALKVA
ncbi:sulfotransferase [Parasphingorhabdus cellanae]|uniref:Sulfotransferase domain-containing protein n=1 Tax=Parasphingorhabdus cellanae TaxID=2806553 RepID=A0ABX7T7I1_9SPHN|nr:sulfotransferase [Parasphingorhabdus cellanae]QTD56462.1 hypothetical protein J4G78_02345 [Parasphingorhabdus cellanae]